MHAEAASIWFEIWGAVDQCQKISIFPGKLTINFDFSGQIDEKFRFFFRQKFRNEFLVILGLLQNVRLSKNLPFIAKF